MSSKVLEDSEAVQIMRVTYEQYFNYVVLRLFTKLVKADYNSKFHPSIKNSKQSNPDIKNGSLLMAKNVNILCWALFQDALLELHVQRVATD